MSDPVYAAGLAAHPELVALDWPEQRIVAAAALSVRTLLARGGDYHTVRAAARLLDPAPLSGHEIATFDGLSRLYGDRTIARDLAGRAWPVLASIETTRARQRDLGRRLARIDQQLADKLLAAAVATLREALLRAGVKARVRARKRAKGAQAALETDGMTEAVLAAIAVNADELLDRAFAGYGTEAEGWMSEANRKRRKAIALAWGLDEDEVEDEDEDSRAGHAVAVLTGLLLGVARRALSSTSPSAEPVVSVPFAVIRTAMRIRDGATAVVGVRGIETVPGRDPVGAMIRSAAERATPLPNLDALAAGEVVPVDLTGVVPELVQHFEWIHGYFGEPKTPFEPHLALDGQIYTDETRGEVLAKDPAEWPEGRFEWSVDDHDSCTCYEVVTWEPV